VTWTKSYKLFVHGCPHLLLLVFNFPALPPALKDPALVGAVLLVLEHLVVFHNFTVYDLLELPLVQCLLDPEILVVIQDGLELHLLALVCRAFLELGLLGFQVLVFGQEPPLIVLRRGQAWCHWGWTLPLLHQPVLHLRPWIGRHLVLQQVHRGCPVVHSHCPCCGISQCLGRRHCFQDTVMALVQLTVALLLALLSSK